MRGHKPNSMPECDGRQELFVRNVECASRVPIYRDADGDLDQLPTIRKSSVASSMWSAPTRRRFVPHKRKRLQVTDLRIAESKPLPRSNAISPDEAPERNPFT